MKQNATATMDFRAFEATPGLHVIVRGDAPFFTVAAVSHDFLLWTRIRREDIVGKSYFAFTKGGDINAGDRVDLRSAFQDVLRDKTPIELTTDNLPMAHHTPGKGSGLWKVKNVPLLNESGEVMYIIHSAARTTSSLPAGRGASDKGIERAYQFFMQAPVIIGYLRSEDYIIELANDNLLKVWKRTKDVFGKRLFDVFPELEQQGIRKLLDNVRVTGKPFFAYEFPLTFDVNGRVETLYFDFVYHAYYEGEDDKIAAGIISVGHDVTDKVLAKQKFKNVIEQTENPILILKGEDMRIEAANAAMFRIWNADDSVIGKQLLEVRPHLGGKGFLEKLQKVYRTGEPYQGFGTPVVVTENDKPPRTIYLNYTYQPYREGTDEIVGVMVLASDATEQVMARQQLEESERKWKELADTMPVIVWTGDARGNVTFFNRGWYEFTGLSEAESRNFGWTKVIHPDDLERCLKAWGDAQVTGIFYEIEMRYRTKEGNYRWVIARGVPIKENGNLVAWYGTSTDIHEQKQLELHLEEKVRERTQELAENNKLLDNILKNSSNGIAVSEMIRDENGNIVDAVTILANDSAVNFSGLPRDLYLSKRATELDPNLMTSPYGEACLKTLATGEPSLMQYYLDFTGKWLELTVSKMDDDHLIHIFTDVTPIKKVQLELERYLEDLKFANANLEEFAYAASHDLKEPVRKIRFFANRLLEGLKDRMDDDSSVMFGRLDKAAGRMEKLIDDLLEYSQAAKGASSVEVLDLNNLIGGVLEDLEVEIQSRQARVSVSALPVIMGNARQVQQMFQNLISNALKYSRPDVPPEIAIDSQQKPAHEVLPDTPPESQTKQYHAIRVSDNGIGFEQRDADRIFNLFTRLNTDVAYRGSGIGLSIVRKVAESHHGFIHARSEVGKGSVFTILLPVSDSVPGRTGA